ncbi:MAG: caspase family protein [Kofleriaceae bacterium]
MGTQAVTSNYYKHEIPLSESIVAILLGAGEYPRKPIWSNPVLSKTARAFSEYIRSSTGFGLARNQILDLFDDGSNAIRQLTLIEEFLIASGSAAQDLIVYYVGHGSFIDREYCLAISDTCRDREFITTIESAKLARAIRRSFSRKRVYIIIDACFSASAVNDWQGGEIEAAIRKAAQQLPTQGTAFLAATSKDDVACAGRDQRYTRFTGAILEVLARGVDNAHPKLSMFELYEEVRTCLRNRPAHEGGQPEIHDPSQPDGNLSLAPLFPNIAHPATIEAARSRRDRGPMSNNIASYIDLSALRFDEPNSIQAILGQDFKPTTRMPESPAKSDTSDARRRRRQRLRRQTLLVNILLCLLGIAVFLLTLAALLAERKK